MFTTLHIRLLGQFGLTRGDGCVAVRLPPRAQTLLAYLLLHRDAPQPRQRLAFLLWPDSSEAQARTNLRKLLHQLRHAWPAADTFLVDEATTLQWRHDAPFTLDVASFEQAVARGGQAAQAGDHAAGRAAWEEALSLYQGALLPDCYDDWVLPERERLHQLYLTATEALIRILEKAEEYRQAIRVAQHLLQHDPLHEATYRDLIRLHALSGDRTGALRVYRTCATVLERELGVEPGAATRELLERLGRAAAPPRPPDLAPAPATRRHNLPLLLTSFIGRDRELAEVSRLLADTRLLTLTGMGGSGKTRLALQVAAGVAAREPWVADGVWWVELEALRDPALVAQAVVNVLGVPEQPGRSLLETLAGDLRAKQLVLVLDNCEHLVEACAQLAERVLRCCPGLRILATSREVLGIAGETTWSVPGLELPVPARPGRRADPAQSEAVRLFAERAMAALPTFRLTERNVAAIAEICRRLDGIPLAIELAAARVRLLTVDQIAARLNDALRLLTGSSRSAPPRHQTLEAAIDWSYALLPAPERALLRRLAVFTGGFTLEAAEAVCGPEGTVADVLDLLAHLIDKSLVLVGESWEGAVGPGAGLATARYRLLETVRQYAWQRLCAAGEAQASQRQHARFFLALAEQTEPQLTGEAQVYWLGCLEAEHDNLRAALQWMLDQAEVESAVRLSAALYRFWEVHGHTSEGRRWFDLVLTLLDRGAAPADRRSKALRAKALLGAGWLAHDQGDVARATAWYQESLALHQELEDKRGISMLLNLRGILAYDRGDFAAAGQQYEASLALWRELGDKRGIVTELNNLGYLAQHQGDHARAMRLLSEALALARERGEKRGIALTLHSLGAAALELGDHDQAVALLQEGLLLLRDVGDARGIAVCFEGLAAVAAVRGAAARAAWLCGAAEALRSTIGTPRSATARAHYERLVAASRARLGPAAWAAAWSAGHSMPFEQAIACALEPHSRDEPAPTVAGDVSPEPPAASA